jgi:4-amino-4-deoxy-L-arabinose transferase-like glycosyltransferase
MTSLAAERISLARAPDALTGRVGTFLARSHLRTCAILLVFALAFFLPGFVSLQPMDRDEPRYAQATKQMLETGDFTDIRFQDEARHKKPVGIYWLQAAAVTAGEAVGIPSARTTIALYRLPSLLGAVATVLLTYWAALAFTTRHGAFLAALMMASSILLGVEARLAKTDAVLAACSVAVMGGLARTYLSRGAGRLSARALGIFWCGMALGILVKGPLILLFAGLASAVLSFRERWAGWLLGLRPGAGVIFTLLVVAPWFVAIAARSGGAFFAASVGHDMLGKVGTAQTYHWAPPGYYLATFFATFWPASVLAAIAAPFLWKQRRDDGIAFALAWIVPAWIVFEIVPTKLPHYILPILPAAAILTSMSLLAGAVGPERRGSRWAALVIPAIPTALLAGLSFAGMQLDGRPPFIALPFLSVSALTALIAWIAFSRGQAEQALLVATASAFLLMAGVFGFAQRDLRSLKLSPRLAEVAQGLRCEPDGIASVGYREPSLIFLTRTDLDLLETGAQAAEFLSFGGCRLVFVERRFEPEFRAGSTSLGLVPQLVTRVTGFNINGGHRLDIGAYVTGP